MFIIAAAQMKRRALAAALFPLVRNVDDMRKIQPVDNFLSRLQAL